MESFTSCLVSPSAVLVWRKHHRRGMALLPPITTSTISGIRISGNSNTLSVSILHGDRWTSRSSVVSYCSSSSSSSSSDHGENDNKKDDEAGEREGEAAHKEEDEEVVVERALSMDGSIPSSADELVRRVSSRAYEMRSKLKKTIDSSSYDEKDYTKFCRKVSKLLAPSIEGIREPTPLYENLRYDQLFLQQLFDRRVVLESNPWREYPKSVYVLTQRENQLCTMKTRRSRSEVEKELGMLFSGGGKRKSDVGKRSKQPSTKTKFRMLVEDIREGILVFEDENDAEKYCDLLRGGQGCEGIAEVDASSVFDIVQKMRALAVLFRRGRALPLPETLQLNLKARNRSLEDQ